MSEGPNKLQSHIVCTLSAKKLFLLRYVDEFAVVPGLHYLDHNSIYRFSASIQWTPSAHKPHAHALQLVLTFVPKFQGSCVAYVTDCFIDDAKESRNRDAVRQRYVQIGPTSNKQSAILSRRPPHVAPASALRVVCAH
jgi:hypothetical protein